MIRSRLLTCLLALALLPACAASSRDNAAGPTEFATNATVVRVVIEGGFYGLTDSSGRRFDPGELPAAFRVDGLAVRVVLRRLPAAVTTRMWGERVELVSIARR